MQQKLAARSKFVAFPNLACFLLTCPSRASGRRWWRKLCTSSSACRKGRSPQRSKKQTSHRAPCKQAEVEGIEKIENMKKTSAPLAGVSSAGEVQKAPVRHADAHARRAR